MPQVVGENLGGLHPGPGAEPFHLGPDVGAVQGAARPADEYRAGADSPPGAVGPQKAAQLLRQQHHAASALVGDEY